MVQFSLKPEEVKEWFPETYKTFIEELRNSKSSSNDKSEEKIEWGISWAFFRKKSKTDEEKVLADMEYEQKMHLTYEERCKVDLSKMRINLSMKAGNYIRTDRSIDKDIPKYVVDMHYETMKITMLQEQMTINDPAVLESLAPFKHLLDELMQDMGITPEMMETLGDKLPGFSSIQSSSNTKRENTLNMDEILDKINETGIQSLTAKELKFLEQMSKN
jgi:cation transport regulator ChaB